MVERISGSRVHLTTQPMLMLSLTLLLEDQPDKGGIDRSVLPCASGKTRSLSVRMKWL